MKTETNRYPDNINIFAQRWFPIDDWRWQKKKMFSFGRVEYREVAVYLDNLSAWTTKYLYVWTWNK